MVLRGEGSLEQGIWCNEDVIDIARFSQQLHPRNVSTAAQRQDGDRSRETVK